MTEVIVTPVVETVSKAELEAAQAKTKEAETKAAQEAADKVALTAEIIELRKKKGVSPEEHASALQLKDGEIAELTKQLALAHQKMNDKQLGDAAAAPIVPTTPPASTPSPLTPEQEELRKTKGWTVEKYLAMKLKYPKVVL